MFAPITSPLNIEGSGDLYYLHFPVSYTSALTLFVASWTLGSSSFILAGDLRENMAAPV